MTTTLDTRPNVAAAVETVESHLHPNDADPARMTEGLGTLWHLPDTAIKPYPVCHFDHGCIDAAIELNREIAGRPIRSITAWLPADGWRTGSVIGRWSS